MSDLDDPSVIVVRSTEDRRPDRSRRSGSEYDPAPPARTGRVEPVCDQYRTLRDVYTTNPDEGVGEPPRKRRRGSRMDM